MILKSCKAGAAIWLDEFYQQAGYLRAVSKEDDVYYAEKNGQKLGVVRVSNEHGYPVLRGMQILESYRGRGIGSELLEFLQESIGPEPMFCIPNDHLVNFYGKIGFSEIEPGDAPEFLAERLNGYLLNGLKVLIMMREGT